MPVLNLNYRNSIEIRPSIIGYAEKTIALTGGGKELSGVQLGF